MSWEQYIGFLLLELINFYCNYHQFIILKLPNKLKKHRLLRFWVRIRWCSRWWKISISHISSFLRKISGSWHTGQVWIISQRIWAHTVEQTPCLHALPSSFNPKQHRAPLLNLGESSRLWLDLPSAEQKPGFSGPQNCSGTCPQCQFQGASSRESESIGMGYTWNLHL